MKLKCSTCGHTGNPNDDDFDTPDPGENWHSHIKCIQFDLTNESRLIQTGGKAFPVGKKGG